MRLGSRRDSGIDCQQQVISMAKMRMLIESLSENMLTADKILDEILKDKESNPEKYKDIEECLTRQYIQNTLFEMHRSDRRNAWSDTFPSMTGQGPGEDSLILFDCPTPGIVVIGRKEDGERLANADTWLIGDLSKMSSQPSFEDILRICMLRDGRIENGIILCCREKVSNAIINLMTPIVSSAELFGTVSTVIFDMKPASKRLVDLLLERKPSLKVQISMYGYVQAVNECLPKVAVVPKEEILCVKDLPFVNSLYIPRITKLMMDNKTCPSFMRKWNRVFELNHRWFADTGTSNCNLKSVCEWFCAMDSLPTHTDIRLIEDSLKSTYLEALPAEDGPWAHQEYDYTKYTQQTRTPSGKPGNNNGPK